MDGRCDSRLPLSGIVGHVNGAHVTDQYCEMYLNSGGWELFAMDGNGNSKANNLLNLQSNRVCKSTKYIYWVKKYLFGLV